VTVSFLLWRKKVINLETALRYLDRLSVYVSPDEESVVRLLLPFTLSEMIDLLGEMGVKGNLRAEDVLESFKGLGMGGGRQ
jgi:hypothetical protein